MRKESKKYYFSVEGKTEERYFKWLMKEINSHKDATQKVNFDIEVTDNPISYAKSLYLLSAVAAFHITDLESTSEDHKKRFEKELEDMCIVTKKMSKKVSKYQLGYSNLSFELWMILHKIDCFAPANRCSDYLPSVNEAFNVKFQSIKEFKREKEFNKILNSLTLLDVIDAIERAKKITIQNERNGYLKFRYKEQSYYNENPSLSVHEIIEQILKDVGLL